MEDFIQSIHTPWQAAVAVTIVICISCAIVAFFKYVMGPMLSGITK